jgi:ribose transport system substrate-binding protein
MFLTRTHYVVRNVLRRHGIAWTAAAVIVAATIATPLGVDASAASNGVAKARAAVATASTPPTTFRAPGVPFNASKAAGKSIWVVAPLSVPLAQFNIQGLQQAAKLVGATVHPCDGQAVVSNTVTCIQEAVAAHAGVILVEDVDTKSLAGPISAAKAANIPVIAVEEHDPQLPPSSDPPAVVAELNQCHACAGKLMADATIANSNGKANAAVFWSSDVSGIGNPQLTAMKAEFKALCKACTLTVIDVPVANWATELPTETRSFLASHPNINYLLPLYDGMVSYILPSVEAAGAGSKVKIVSYNATPSVIQDMAHNEVVVANVGSNALEWGWYWGDQSFRVLTGVKPSVNEAPPIRLFTTANVGSIDVSASQTTWYGKADLYQQGFKKLWGVG